MEPETHFQTDRLSLQPLSLDDLSFFCRLVGNEDVRRYLGGPVSRNECHSRFRHYLAGATHACIWKVHSTEHNEAIGLVELGPHQDGQDFEVSYQFCPSYWGNGFAAETVGSVIEHCLSRAKLKRIIAETQTANTASCRLLKGIGMIEIERVQRFGAEQIIFATK